MNTRITIPDWIWSPLAVGALLAVPGVASLMMGQPWLFPSLGPTAFLQAERPDLASARLYNVVVGHFLALAAGMLAVTICGASEAPSVLSSHEVVPVRLTSALLAILLTMSSTSLLRASHPPAAATALLIALGGMNATAREAETICVGVLMVGACGEVVRQIRLRYIMPANKT